MADLNYKRKEGQNDDYKLSESQVDKELSPFAMFCVDFLSHFSSPYDTKTLNQCIANIMDYLSDLQISIESEFNFYNFAEILMQYLEIDETPTTITCILYCTAHDDSISTMFIENNFLDKANELLTENRFISQILRILSNMASIDDNRQIISSFIPYETIYLIADANETDEMIMISISKLIYNLSKDSNIPLDLINFLSSKLLASSFEEVRFNALWSLHHILLRSNSLSYKHSDIIQVINDNNLSNIYEDLLSDGIDENLKYLGCCLLGDMIRITPDKFRGFDCNLLVPFFNSENSSLRSTAVLCYKNLFHINSDQINVNNLIETFVDILPQVQYNVKNSISDLFIQIVMDFNRDNILIALNNGLFSLISELLDIDNSSLHLKTAKLLTRIIYALKDSQTDDSLPQIQFFANQIEENDILHRLEAIEEVNNENIESIEEVDRQNFALADEIRIFKLALYQQIYGIQEIEFEDLYE